MLNINPEHIGLIERIIIHWTGGGGTANSVDKEAYNFLVEQDTNIIQGNNTIGDNVTTADGEYAAHTLNLNSGSIGIGMCGMRGAVENPFDVGPSPLNERQFRATAEFAAELCSIYAIPVTPETVLTHAEVEPNLGVKQNNKWDIIRLPWDDKIRGARAVGDHFRDLVLEAQGKLKSPPYGEIRPTLRKGNKTPLEDVRVLQYDLIDAGHPVGAVDGLFGSATEAAVLAFQARVGLETDGIVGPKTWRALGFVDNKPERDITMGDLRERGSETIKQADRAEVVTMLGVGGATITEAINLIEEARSTAEPMINLLGDDLVKYAAILVIVVIIMVLLNRMKNARLADARSGKHMGR